MRWRCTQPGCHRLALYRDPDRCRPCYKTGQTTGSLVIHPLALIVIYIVGTLITVGVLRFLDHDEPWQLGIIWFFVVPAAIITLTHVQIRDRLIHPIWRRLAAGPDADPYDPDR